jgi:hypothetical protein
LHEGNDRRNSVPYYNKRMEDLKSTAVRGKLKNYRNALYEGKPHAQEYVDYTRMGGSNGAEFVENGYDSRNGVDHSIDFDLIEILDLDTQIKKED